MRNKMVLVFFVIATVGVYDTITQLSPNPLDTFPTSSLPSYYFIFVSQAGHDVIPGDYTPPPLDQGSLRPFDNPFPPFDRRAISNGQFTPYSAGGYPFQGNYPSFQPQQPGDDSNSPQNFGYPGPQRGGRGYPPMRFPPPPHTGGPNPFDNVYNEEGEQLHCRMVCLTDEPMRSRGRSSGHKKREKEETSSEEEDDDDKKDKKDEDKKSKSKDDQGNDDKKEKKDGDKDKKKNSKENK